MFRLSNFRKISGSKEKEPKEKKPKISHSEKRSKQAPPSAAPTPSIHLTPPSNLPNPRYLQNIPRISPRLDIHVNQRPSRIPTPDMKIYQKDPHINILPQGKFSCGSHLKPSARSLNRQPPDYQKRLPEIPQKRLPEPPGRKISTYRRVTTSILTPCKTPVQKLSRFLMTNSETAPIPPPPRQRALTSPHPTPPKLVPLVETPKKITSLIEEDMPEEYWCGRFSALSDRVVCEHPDLGNDERREVVLARLLKSCKGEGARRSYFRFREKLVDLEKKQRRNRTYAS